MNEKLEVSYADDVPVSAFMLERSEAKSTLPAVAAFT